MSRTDDRWTPEILEMFGVLPDLEISRRTGIPKQTIWGKRTRMNIPAVLPPGRPVTNNKPTTAISSSVLNYARSKELSDEVKHIRKNRIDERLALNWDVAAHARLLHHRHYLWVRRVLPAAPDRPDFYADWLRRRLVRRVVGMGDLS